MVWLTFSDVVDATLAMHPDRGDSQFRRPADVAVQRVADMDHPVRTDIQQLEGLPENPGLGLVAFCLFGGDHRIERQSVPLDRRVQRLAVGVRHTAGRHVDLPKEFPRVGIERRLRDVTHRTDRVGEQPAHVRGDVVHQVGIADVNGPPARLLMDPTRIRRVVGNIVRDQVVPNGTACRVLRGSSRNCALSLRLYGVRPKGLSSPKDPRHIYHMSILAALSDLPKSLSSFCHIHSLAQSDLCGEVTMQMLAYIC